MDENRPTDRGNPDNTEAPRATPNGEIPCSNEGTPPLQQESQPYDLIAEVSQPPGHYYQPGTQYDTFSYGQPVMTTAVGQPRPVIMAPPRPPARLLPIALFFITCFTTLTIGTPGNALTSLAMFFVRGQLPKGNTWEMVTDGLYQGFQYAGPLMLILLCHEMGHYIQARRNRIPASLPYFIPMPFGPLGTMGAVIGMRANLGDRRSLFDIGITGPLAGLIPTLIFLFIGLHYSTIGSSAAAGLQLGEPLLMQWAIHLKFGTISAGQDILLHPMAFAAWVGLLITSLNLIPIGQLDGGHVLHALLPRSAAHVARILLYAAIFASFFFEYYTWMLMIILLLLMGPKHPPTADDRTPIGPFRTVLGWLTLAFIFIGFTPFPFQL